MISAMLQTVLLEWIRNDFDDRVSACCILIESPPLKIKTVLLDQWSQQAVQPRPRGLGLAWA
jgi:hypothetical protein